MITKLLIAVAALAALGCGWLAFLLIPAHLQIRDVDPVFPEAGEIEAFFSTTPASAGPVSVHYVNTATQASPALTISHVGAVRGIVLTHLHSDHTQGVTALCGAGSGPVTVLQTGTQATRHNLHTEAGQALISGSNCEMRRLDPAPIAPLPGFPGVGAIAAGGHTPGSTVYLARVAGETYVFAGDLANAMAGVAAGGPRTGAARHRRPRPRDLAGERARALDHTVSTGVRRAGCGVVSGRLSAASDPTPDGAFPAL